MGRYAQSRRRGRSLLPTVGLQPPPAPSLYDQAGNLLCDSGDASDLGGTIRLEWEATPGGGWELAAQVGWATTVDFGPIANLDPGNYRAIENGNGVDFVGDSPASNIFAA